MKLNHIARFMGHDSLESTQIYTHIVHKKSFKEYLLGKQFSDSTVKIYENGVKEFLEWIIKHHYQEENIRYVDLMSYIKHSQKKGKSKLNIQHELLAIRHYFNYLVKAGKALVVKIKPHYYFYKHNRPSKCQKISPSPMKS